MKRKHFILALVAMLSSVSLSTFADIYKVSNEVELREALTASGALRSVARQRSTAMRTSDLGSLGVNTIDLTHDVTVSEPITTNVGSENVINLNGFTIQGAEVEGAATKHLFPIYNLGQLTIENGTAEGGVIDCGIYNGYTYNETDPTDGDVVSGAELIMKGGSIVCHDVDGAAIINYATATIAGGGVEGAQYALWNKSGAKMTVESGAKITGEVKVEEGAEINAPEGVFTVASIGDVKYVSLESAFAEAEEGATITLLRDATPTLTSQSAITKATVIDLGGKTLTLTEDDLYFGTTTFKNGTIVVAPSVSANTAVFWMFAGQTLTFDDVDIVATGVTGTYLIGINDGTGAAVNLLNGSSITIKNDATTGLTAVIADNGSGNTVTINDATINVDNIEGRFYLGGTQGVVIVENSTVQLNGVKEGFYLRAGQTLDIAGTSKVSITLNNSDSKRYGINQTDLTTVYTKAETAKVDATVYAPIVYATIDQVKYGSLQAAIDAAANGDVIILQENVTEDVKITQKADLDLTIDGNDKTFTGIMTVFGDGRQSGSETLKIQKVNFVAKEGADACILSPDKEVNNKYSYSHNVTVENCTFTDPDGTVNCAAIRHEDGGDKNWTVTSCSVDETMHSLLQVNNVAGKLVVDNCIVKSKNGLNLNSCTNVELTNNTIEVKGYAVRTGVNTGGSLGAAKSYVMKNNTLKTDNSEGDAVIVFRASTVDATLSMEKNAVSGNIHISGHTADTKISADANYWDGKSAPFVGSTDTPITVNSYYSDEARSILVRNVMGDTSIIGYTRADAIWGESWGNAEKSYVIKVFDDAGNVMGTTTLNNVGGIIDGDVEVTWSIKLDAASNTDEYWTMEWTTVPTIDNMPAKVQLWIDGKEVGEGPVKLNAPDDLNPINAAVLAEDGKTITAYHTTFAKAVEAGNNVAILTAGTYSVPTGKNLTITGAVEGVVFDNIGACNMGGANVTFNNVTFDYYPNVNYTGLQHSGNLVYNNCTINGQVFLYGTSETFNNCTFNQNSADAYNVWTYGAKEVAFNECTFNSAGKSVLVYNEGACATQLTVEKTNFTASAPVEGKAAIEFDTSLMPGATTATITNSKAEGFALGNVSGNSLWNNKKGNADAANNDITITVDGEVVLQPIYDANVTDAEGNVTGYRTFADALAAAQAGETITLLTDLNTTEVIKIEKAITIDLGKKTVTADCKKAFEVYADATFKNGTITAQERCVDTRKAVNLTLDGVHLIADKYYTANQQPLTIGGSEHGTKLTMTNSTIDAGTQGYAIITFVKTEATITGSEISGYSALYAKIGSEESVFNFESSKLTATNEGNDVAGNSFSAIALEANKVTVNIDSESSVTANGNHMWAIHTASEATGNKVTVAGDITGNLLSTANVVANTFIVKADYTKVLNQAGFAVAAVGEDGLVQVKGATNFAIGSDYYATFAEALAAVQNDQTITIAEGAVGDEKSTEIDFTRPISFTITGNAPEYALPTVTFANTDSDEKIVVTIKDAKILISELDARQNATINVENSTVYDAGGNSIAKSYFNGTINIDETSTVYMMQVTTMGYINVAGTLNATWQTNVYGNGMITLAEGATFNTAALHLTGQDYSDRDNTDAERVGKPATIVVDGANFTVGNVKSYGGADYSYNSSKGINVGTVEGKNAVLDIKNDANVNIYMADGETANIGAGGTVNVGASTLNVLCRKTEGTVALANNGTINFTSKEATLTAQEGLTINHTLGDSYKVEYNDGVYSISHYVASVNGVNYQSLQEALKALTDGATLTLLEHITVTEPWDCRDNGAKVTANNVIIEGNGKTLKLTGAVIDKNWNTVFRFEGDNATVKNLTIDASEATGIQRGITAKLNITVDKCTFIGNVTSAKRAIIFGEGAGNALAEVVATVTNSTFKNWSYGVSDNQSGKDAKKVTITGNTFENASVLVSASKSIFFDKNTMKKGSVNITSYTNAANAKVQAIDNTLDSADDQITINPANIVATGFNIPVASANDKYYLTLQKAIDEVADNGVVTLVANTRVTLTEAVEIAASGDAESKTLTLDLNGKKLYASADSTMTGGIIRLLDGANLTITGEGEISHNGNSNVYTAVGVLGNNVKLTVNGANLTGYYYGIAGNGNKSDTEVTINGGAITADADGGVGIYHPQSGTLTVTDGEITGATGIYFKGGKLDIQGGIIKATGTAVDYEYNGSGCVATGDALVIENAEANGYAAIEAVSITGGTFISENAAPIASYAPAGSDALAEFIGEDCNAQFSNGNIDESILAIGYQLTKIDGADYYGVEYTNYRESMTFIDGEFEAYTIAEDMRVGTLTYQRASIPTTWTPFYVPFEVPVSKLAEQGFEVAYINGVRRGDTDFDGELDEFVMEVIFIHGGENCDGSNKTLKANYPYFLRSKGSERKDLDLVLYDVLLHTEDENIYDCTTMTERFTLIGNLSKVTIKASDDKALRYTVSGGQWSMRTKDSDLNPFRFSMELTSRSENTPTLSSAPTAMSIAVRGEERPDGTTLIYDVEADNQNADYIYDLQGRRVLEPQKGSLYIVNGKKIVF